MKKIDISRLKKLVETFKPVQAEADQLSGQWKAKVQEGDAFLVHLRLRDLGSRFEFDPVSGQYLSGGERYKKLPENLKEDAKEKVRKTFDEICRLAERSIQAKNRRAKMEAELKAEAHNVVGLATNILQQRYDAIINEVVKAIRPYCLSDREARDTAQLLHGAQEAYRRIFAYNNMNPLPLAQRIIREIEAGMFDN